MENYGGSFLRGRKLVLAVHALQFSVSAAKKVQLRISRLQHIKVSLTVGQPYSLVVFPLKYCLIHR